MIEFYRAQLRIIETIFGVDWLENRKRGQKRPKPPKHPVQKLWRAARQILHNATLAMVDDRALADLADMADLASALHLASRLQGFQELMLPKIKDKKCRDQHPSFLYELTIAAWHAGVGQQVRFIPTRDTEGIKTPDLGIDADGTTVRIECKRRERIRPLKMSQETRSFIMEAMRTTLGDLRQNIEYLVLVLGEPGKSPATDALSSLKAFAASGGRGIQSLPDKGLWFFVRDCLAPPPHPIRAIAPRFLLDSPGPTTAFAFDCHVVQDHAGYVQVLDWKLGRLFTLDSHSLKQLAYSFNEGRKQFSKDELGAVYIDVDPAGMDPKPLQWYMDLMGRALSDLAWCGGQNTRIGAIALSAGPLRRKANVRGLSAVKNDYLFNFNLAPHLAAGREQGESPIVRILSPFRST